MSVLTAIALSLVVQTPQPLQVGQYTPDGSLVVCTGQRIRPAGRSWTFAGRPTDVAVDPGSGRVAVLHQWGVGLIDSAASKLPKDWLVKFPSGQGSAYHGIAFSPTGRLVYASCSDGTVQRLDLESAPPKWLAPIELVEKGKKNPVPGGLTLSRDGSRLYVCAATDCAVYEVDTQTAKVTSRHKTGAVPYTCVLSPDEKTLFVSNWGGREPQPGEETWKSDGVPVAVDKHGSASSGTVTVFNLAAWSAKNLVVGLHPSGMALTGDGRLFVCNANSDTISVVRTTDLQVAETIRLRYQARRLFGSMPNDCAVSEDGKRLFVADGGDNALAVFDITGQRAKLDGFVPTGFFPGALAIGGKKLFVANMKGNGSRDIRRDGGRFNSHDFQGSVTVWPAGDAVEDLTVQVAANNDWDGPPTRPKLRVYSGAIKHVVYIIKENRTYDQILGDMPEGNGRKEFCIFGEQVTPNQHKIAREFALFDNAYCSGTNSADGHQWADEAICADYLEKFYGGYVRSYPYDGDDPMAYSPAGFLWDNALDHGLRVRVYGEFVHGDVSPKPKDCMETWLDRKNGVHKFKGVATPNVGRLKDIMHPNYIGWPLLLSDQYRADVFIEEFNRLQGAGTLPNLMILSLPANHTEGMSEGYPTPRAMVADNDLATGRIIEAVSKSPAWAQTCVIVIEDDAQAGFDHVDGHRTTMFVASPYVKRRTKDGSFYNQASLVHSIELMLGLPPMNRFDAMTPPFDACFTETPDLQPYAVTPNTVPLDEMNPRHAALSGPAHEWAERSDKLDFSEVDAADWDTLNHLLWHMYKGYDTSYPTGAAD